MCRNIRPLFHFEPPVTNDEIRDASLQFVRKVSGFTKPSAANQAPFDRAVDEVSEAVTGCSLAGDHHPTEEPRGRSGQGAGARREALRPAGR